MPSRRPPAALPTPPCLPRPAYPPCLPRPAYPPPCLPAAAAAPGVFGTNFDAVTAYHWHDGFWFFWGLCAAVTLVFVLLLRYWGMFTR
jgi:hypothetical protein